MKYLDITKYSSCGGWAGKLGPGALNDIMTKLPIQNNENLICGFTHNEDAAVYKLKDELLISTLDFFSPNHHDPYTFGQIAAANSLSDVFAMGGEVMYALNILAIPKELDSELVAEILKGAIERVNLAGGVVVGGHTVEDTEIKYGLSVTGRVVNNLLTNDKAKANMKIILTKRIGTGIYNNEFKKDRLDVQEVVKSMTSLNNVPAHLFTKYGINACTDVTGFGLAGHLIEVMKASKVSATLNMSKIPLFERTMELADNTSGGMTRNILYFSENVTHNLTKKEQNIIFDPQTSGGLLIFVDNELAEDMLKDLLDAGFKDSTIIGSTVNKLDYDVLVVE